MLEEIKSYTFLVNSLETTADYYKEDIESIFIPLIDKLKLLQEDKKRRIIVYLAASPGVGKSTLSLFLEHLSQINNNSENIQSIGIDGFHYPQEYIKNNSVIIDNIEVSMSNVKGCPETFDLDKLKMKIQSIRTQDTKWPIYDRKLHDVVEDKILVTKDIVIIEGNWLLLKEEKWEELEKYCDYSIFITAQESMLKNRLIDRKIKGGISKEAATKFYEISDKKNVYRVLSNKLSADLELELLSTGKYIKRG